jgi:hypothetical protein
MPLGQAESLNHARAAESTPIHDFRHAARPHAHCGFFDAPTTPGDGRPLIRVDRAVGIQRSDFAFVSRVARSLRSTFTWGKEGVSYDEREGGGAEHGRGDIRPGR